MALPMPLSQKQKGVNSSGCAKFSIYDYGCGNAAESENQKKKWEQRLYGLPIVWRQER